MQTVMEPTPTRRWSVSVTRDQSGDDARSGPLMNKRSENSSMSPTDLRESWVRSQRRSGAGVSKVGSAARLWPASPARTRRRRTPPSRWPAGPPSPTGLPQLAPVSLPPPRSHIGHQWGHGPRGSWRLFHGFERAPGRWASTVSLTSLSIESLTSQWKKNGDPCGAYHMSLRPFLPPQPFIVFCETEMSRSLVFHTTLRLHR